MKTAKNVTRTQANHHADILNDNKKTSGTNVANAKMHGNRGKQLNPNNRGQPQTDRPRQTPSKRQGN